MKTVTMRFIFKIEFKNWEVAYAYDYSGLNQYPLAIIKKIEKILVQ